MKKLIVVLTTILFTTPVFADIWGNCYTCNLPKPSENWTQRQKIERGLIPNKKYTTCRLKKRITSKYTDKRACIYQGGNKTFTMLIESWCPKKYKCVYDPNGTEPDIDKVMESLRSIGRK